MRTANISLTVMTLFAVWSHTALCRLSDQDRQMLMVGLRDVRRETTDGAVTLESGSVPAWLSGNFIRHSCGAFGEVDHMTDNPINYISHMFDCIEIGSKFRLDNGTVTFTNKWYDTTTQFIYQYYGMDMNRSSVFMSTALSKINATQVSKFSNMLDQSNSVDDVPHVSWWQIGNEAIAMTETPVGVVVDPNNVAQKGHVQYTDDNFGYGDSVIFSNNPAHEHTEPDGTLWSTVVMSQFVSRSYLKQWRVVYKVGADRHRKLVGRYPHGDVDLTKCSQQKPYTPYPDMTSRFGYLHSFAMTENYIILPEAAYMFDPCVYGHYQSDQPYFNQSFRFESTGYSRLLVMRKSDGMFVKAIETKPFFVTHQVFLYYSSQRMKIHMDMLMYNDSSIYTDVTYVKSLLTENPYVTDVTRITLNTTDWQHKFTDLRRGTRPQAFEMSNINYCYNTRKYTYAYMVRNFDRIQQNAITKLNVDTGVETEYVLPTGMFPQEPQFIARPNSVAEDDGVILSQGIDGRKQKAFLVILDAKTMTLIAHVTAPDYALFGLHNRFFALDVGKDPFPQIGILG